MSTVGTLLILVGSVVGIVLGVLIAAGAVPLFNEDTKKAIQARKDAASRH